MSFHQKKIVMLLGHDFIHPYPDPRVYKEAVSLVGAGYEVAVVGWSRRRENPTGEERDGIRVYRVFQGIPRAATPLWWRLPAYQRDWGCAIRP